MICDVCMDDIPYNSEENICETLCEKGYYYIEPEYPYPEDPLDPLVEEEEIQTCFLCSTKF